MAKWNNKRKKRHLEQHIKQYNANLSNKIMTRHNNTFNINLGQILGSVSYLYIKCIANKHLNVYISFVSSLFICHHFQFKQIYKNKIKKKNKL
jgi:hypothetical protein